MHKILFWLFKKQFLKLAYQEQNANKTGFEKAVRCFLDSEGRNYFMHINKFDSSTDRLQVIMFKERRFKYGLDPNEEDLLLSAMKKAVNSGKNSDMVELGFLFTELDRRKDIIRTPDMLFDLIATYYIREDENPSIFNEAIHQEKIKQFKKDSAGGLRDFFYMSGLMTSLNLPDLTEKDFLELLMSSSVSNQALMQHLKAYTTGSNL